LSIQNPFQIESDYMSSLELLNNLNEVEAGVGRTGQPITFQDKEIADQVVPFLSNKPTVTKLFEDLVKDYSEHRISTEKFHSRRPSDILLPKLTIASCSIQGESLLRFGTSSTGLNMLLEQWFNCIQSLKKQASAFVVATRSTSVQVDVLYNHTDKVVRGSLGPKLLYHDGMWKVLAAVRQLLLKHPLVSRTDWATARDHLQGIVLVVLLDPSSKAVLEIPECNNATSRSGDLTIAMKMMEAFKEKNDVDVTGSLWKHGKPPLEWFLQVLQNGRELWFLVRLVMEHACALFLGKDYPLSPKDVAIKPVKGVLMNADPKQFKLSEATEVR